MGKICTLEADTSVCGLTQRKVFINVDKKYMFFFFSFKPDCLQKHFHGRVPTIWVFSSDGHYEQ